MGENYALELRDISKSFGSVQANDHVDLTLRKSEILAILGENGSGKTTLMNMIYGIYYPDEGHIFVNGKEVTIRSPKDSYELGIGMVHQHFKLVDVFTATENIVLGINDKEKFNIKKAEKKVKEITDKYGFDINLESKVYEMSVSEKQTVEIVKVLYRGAQTLILDEPTVGLDPKQIIEIRDLIKSLKKKHTVILSSHILSEVSAVCDYVLIISHGKLVASDTPDNLGKLAQGSNNLSLLVKGDKDKIRILLGEIEGIKEIAINAAKDQEGWEVKLSTEENTDIREEVFFKMAEHHYPILEMQSKKVSLEEIFLELTEDDKKKKPEEPEKEGETK